MMPPKHKTQNNSMINERRIKPLSNHKFYDAVWFLNYNMVVECLLMTDKPNNTDDKSDNPTTSATGSPIYYHKERKRIYQMAFGDNEDLTQIDKHITRHVGEIAWVYRELASDLVHIDVHVINPTHSRNYFKLVTSGMSDLPMTTPVGAEQFQYAELMLCLPPNWKLTKSGLEDHNNYWPIHMLKTLARFPHQYETWFGLGHTIPNGDPPQPMATHTKLCGTILARPLLFKGGFCELKISDEKTIQFLSLIPIYESEIAFKLEHGADALFERFAANNVTELLIQNRDAMC